MIWRVRNRPPDGFWNISRNAPTLEALADIRGYQGDFAESLSLFQRALKVNPLDRSLRKKMATAHLVNARSHAEAGRFAEARAEYQRSLSYHEGKDEVLRPL